MNVGDQTRKDSLQQAVSATTEDGIQEQDAGADDAHTAEKGHRAKPRGLSSEVEQTVSKLSDKSTYAAQGTAASSDSAHQSTTTNEGDSDAGDGVGEVSNTAVHDDIEIVSRDESQSAQQSASSNEGSPPHAHATGQGRPSLSPVRQSQSQSALSNASTPGKGINLPHNAQAAIDMNVICNPLFTEPAGAKHAGSVSQHQGIGRSPGADQAFVDEQGGALADRKDASSYKGVEQELKSPPSKLQQSLRHLMQRHSQGL